MDMGIEPFLIASSVTAVLAQRLVRRLCPHCRQETAFPAAMLEPLGLKAEDGPFFDGKGCSRCLGTGYWGRLGIYELLQVDEPMMELILKRASAGQIQALAVSGGMRTLLAAGALKVRQGKTTPEEVLRVIHA